MSTIMQERKSCSTIESNSKVIAEYIATEKAYNSSKLTMPEPDPTIKALIKEDSPEVSAVQEPTNRGNKKRERKSPAYQLGKQMKLPLNDICFDDRFQVRTKMSPKYIRDYKKRFLDFKAVTIDGEKIKYPFEPVCVWKREGKYVLIAGHHRFESASGAGMDSNL